MSSPSVPQTILFLAAHPTDLGRQHLDQELRHIADGLQQVPFQLEQRPTLRPRDIQRAILEVNPQILHFCGHSAMPDGITFEDASGTLQLIDGEALATLVGLFVDQITCIVLHGCYSTAQATAIAQHIPYVIGISQAVGSQAATEFAIEFYDALGAGRPLELAYKLGCSAIRLSGIPDHLVPVLLKRATTYGADAPQPQPAPSPTPSTGNQTYNFGISGSSVTNLAGSGNIQQNINNIAAPPEPTWMPQPPVVPPTVDPRPHPTSAPPKSTHQGSQRPIEVFFSYSHRDEDLRDEMAKHLSILRRQGVIADWHDRGIGAGTEWAEAIDDHLNSAQVILLLISPDFIASDYCFDIEMQRAMERHEAGEACVIPVILRPVDWSGAPFGKLQACPKNAKPVTSWPNRDEAFLNVTQAIRNAVQRLR